MVKHKGSSEPDAEPVQPDPTPKGKPGPEFDPIQEDVQRPRPAQDPDGTPLGDVPPESGIGHDKGDKANPPLHEHLPSEPGGSPYHLPTPNPGDPQPLAPGDTKPPAEPDRPPAQELYQIPAFDLTAEAVKINETVYARITAAGMDYYAGKQLLERAKVTLGRLWVEKRDAEFRRNVDPKAAPTPQEAAGKSHDTTVIPAARSG